MFYLKFQKKVIDSGKDLNVVQLLKYACLEIEIEKLEFLFKIYITNLKYALVLPNILRP